MSYLNTLPLVWGLLHGDSPEAFDLSFRLPAECADALKNGGADIGLVPSVELVRQPLEIIRGTGIACQGAVRSILLISKTAFSKIGSVAVDSSSRTSVALLRIVLKERFGLVPRITSMAPDLEPMMAEADAALIIGDPALRLDPAMLPYRVLDLGKEWVDWSGLPMVFAVWAGKKEHATVEAGRVFARSYQFGRDQVDQIVKQEAGPRGIPDALARQYLRQNICYLLGEREYEGLQLFLRYARKLPNLS